MPEGLTFKNEKTQSDAQSTAVENSLQQFASIGKTLSENNKELQSHLMNLAMEQKKLQEKFTSEQQMRKLDADILKKQGAKDAEILAYLTKRSDIYNKDTQNMFSSLESLHREVADMVENEENLSTETRLLLRKQLASMEKAYTLSEQQDRHNTSLFESIAENTKGAWKEALESGKEKRGDLFGSLASSLLGPLRLIADPLSELATGKSTKDLFSSAIDNFRNNQETLNDVRDSALEKMISETASKDIFYNEETLNPKNLISPTSLMNDSIANRDILTEAPNISNEQDSPLLEKVSSDENTLLAKGGVIGASAVYIGSLLKDVTGSIIELSDLTEQQSGEGGFLSEVLGEVVGNKIAGLVPTLGSAAGVAAAALLPAAMLAGGAVLQQRDTNDARQHFEEGNTIRGVETAILGDRSHLNQDTNAISGDEIGRTAAKGGLLAGGLAGAGALALGGASTGMAAGAAAAAGGAGALGTMGAAATATLGAIAAPVAIGAAAVAAGMAVAKGTQEALEKEWDKNQSSIQSELVAEMQSEDASFWDKTKIMAEMSWKGLTGSIAGGIRGASEEMTLASKRFEELEKENDGTVKGEVSTFLAKGGVALETAGHSITSFLGGALKTTINGLEGIAGANIDKKSLEDFEKLSSSQKEELKNNSSYAEAIQSGKTEEEALKDSFLQIKREENVALGNQKEDGSSVSVFDWGQSLFNKKDDVAYRDTHEYSKRKAVLMAEGMSSQEADLKAIEEYNAQYDQAMEFRLKQTEDYKEHFEKALKEGKTLKEAEKEALTAARENTRNTMSVTDLAKEKLLAAKDAIVDFASNTKDKIVEGFNTIMDSDIVQNITGIAKSLWDSITEFLGKAVTAVKEGFSNFFSSAKDGIVDFFTGNVVSVAPELLASTPEVTSMEDGIVYKDGKIIKLSPEDNVYATKNEPIVAGDRDAQRAMPSVGASVATMTDENIVGALQTLIQVLKEKTFSANISAGEGAMDVGLYKTV